MRSVGSPVIAALPASAAAGPIFVLSLAAAQAYALVPEPVPFDPGVLLMLLATLVPTALFGFIIAFLPNAIGTHVLSVAGESSETARAPMFWIGVGAALGFGFAMLFGAFEASLPAGFALVVTSAGSAGLCRRGIAWEA